jgi:ABC-type antimicrobial peptide transport system permease subunit
MIGIPRSVGTALRALRRNALRSALTTLGVVIGVAAVITMMEIGQGSAAAIQATILRMGTNNLMVLPGSVTTGAVNYGTGSRQTLTVEDFEVVASECGDLLSAIAPVVTTRAQVVYGNRNWIPTYLYGTTPAYVDVREWREFDEGQMFTAADVRRGAQVCVVGRTLAAALFDDRSPLGGTVRINQQPFKVIGVLASKGANMMGTDQDDILLAPWTAIKYRVAGRPVPTTATVDPTTAAKINTLSQRYPSLGPLLYPTPSLMQLANNPRVDRVPSLSLIWARARTSADIAAARDRIATTLRRQHRISPEETDDFVVRDLTEQGNVLGSTSRLMAGLLLGVALISLAVGGVGIMNIMLVSVTERTREIGLRMAVGARPSDILRQFLVEAVVLCVLGGAIGIACGRGGAELVRLVLAWPTQVSVAAIVAAVSVSVVVGVLFGFYPAWKASRLDPIRALRHE